MDDKTEILTITVRSRKAAPGRIAYSANAYNRRAGSIIAEGVASCHGATHANLIATLEVLEKADSEGKLDNIDMVRFAHTSTDYILALNGVFYDDELPDEARLTVDRILDILDNYALAWETRIFRENNRVAIVASNRAKQLAREDVSAIGTGFEEEE
nr:MAG TPA: hypothetical protein [Caudoviricetes sp.]